MSTPSRHHTLHRFHGPFGHGRFGQGAESFARVFGTPGFLIGQTVLVVAWISVNVVAVSNRWDPYPFILLNLAFSLQAAYAAPLILLAQTRQADRDRALAEADVAHAEAIAAASREREETALVLIRKIDEVLEVNTRLTTDVERLTREVHAHLVAAGPGDGSPGPGRAGSTR